MKSLTTKMNTKIGNWIRNKFSIVVLFAYLISGGFFNFTVLSINVANAAVPKTINFQGKITKTSDGTNVSNSTYAVRFKLYTALSGGSPVWTEAWDGSSGSCPKLTVTNGVFNAKLGGCASLAAVDFSGGAMYLSVDFAPTGTSYDGEMSPRKQLLSSAYALVANSVDGDGVIKTATQSTGALSVSRDGTNPALQVDTNTASSVTGLKVTSAAAGNNVALSVISSGTNENITIDGKGTGTISLGGTSTGDILLGGGSASTGCTIANSTGNLTCSGDVTISGDDLVMGTNTSGYILVADGNNYSPVSMSGDVTINSSGATAIGADKITEAMLKVVDTASDEECLTYETTTGDFEWQACGSSIAADSLNFSDFSDTLTLDASTDIAVAGSNVLSITNTGTGNSLVVNDEAADATPFVIDASGNVSAGGSGAFVGVNAGTGLIQGTGGLTVTSAAVSLNASSNFAVNIGTGTNNALVSIGGGSGTFALDTTNIDISNTGAITNATGFNGLVVTANTGVITTGTWNGTAITDTYVSDTLTSSIFIGSGSTTNAVDLATAEVAGTLGVGNGGSGATTLTGILKGNGASAFTALTTSSGIAGEISDETGSGALVFGTAPTFTTNITSPLVIGGTGASSALTLQSTSGAGTTDSIVFKTGNNGATTALTISTAGNATLAGDLTISGDDLFMATNTSGNILVADGTNYNPVAMSGDVTINSSGATTIGANTVALTTDTTGNYVASVANGSGISGGAAGSEGAALTLALGALTADWNQTGAFDISLNNSSSELKMLEAGSTPTLFGIFDVADLSTADKTYTFPNATGTVITTGNLSDITGLTDSQISDTLTSSIFIGSGSTTNAIDLATAEVAGLLGPANGGTGVNNGSSTITLGGNINTAGAFTTSGANALTLTTTGTTNVTLPTSGTLTSTANKLSDFAATTSSELAGVISDETGTGALVFANTPTLVTPNIGAATATSLNAGSGTIQTTGALQGGATTITSTSANALAVGANGTTNPVLQVDANTASVATGIKITGAAAAGGVAIAAISSGTNENMTINAKGSGTISLGSTSTGDINIGTATTAKTIAIGSTAGDTINIGSAATTAKTINIGTAAVANTIAIGSSSATNVSITDNNWSVTTAGAATFVGMNAGTGLIQGTGGLTVTGAAVSLNASSNFAVNIGTGTNNALVSIGGGSGTFALNTTNIDISNTGAITNATGFNGLVVTANTGVITTGTWNGTAITDAYVSDTLTSSIFIGSGSTTNAIDLATAEVAGTLGVGNGGTGATSFTANGVLYGNTTSAIQVTAAPTGGQVLLGNSSGVPTFTTISGDITISNTGVAAIGADKITESMLKAVDTAEDEECLTYETTTGDFEWQSCGSTIAADSLDFVDFQDTLDLDAALTLNQTTNTWSQTFTGTTTTGYTYTANSLTTGTANLITSSSLTSGNLLSLTSNGTAAATGQTGLNISLQGTNATSTQTTYGAQISNTHAGTGAVNVALQLAASGGASNYALLTNGGNVGIGDTTPAALFTVGSGDLFQVNSSGAIAAVTGYTQGSGTMSLTSTANGTTTGSSFSLTNNTMTTGTGMYLASTSLTSGNFIDIAQTTSTMTGNGIKMNMASTFSGNFLELQTNSATKIAIKSGSVTTSGGSAVAGIFQDLAMSNSTASGFQYGNRLINTISAGGAAATHIGQFIRMLDNTTYDSGQTVRGIEVQAFSGTNLNGTNTGIASFAYTIGLQAATTAQAAAQVAPAAILADLDNGADGTTKARGNAIRAYTNDATSADLVYLFQESSAYTGTALRIDTANSAGTFVGNFIDMQTAGTSRLKIAYSTTSNIVTQTYNQTGSIIDYASGTNGNTFIWKIPQKATSGTCSSGAAEGVIFQNSGGTQVGHMCISGPSVGGGGANKLRFYAEQFSASSTDLAENFSDASGSLVAGEVVMQDSSVTSGVKRATLAGKDKLVGIVATDPGLLLSGISENDGSTDLVNPKPIALAGRVPVKVSTENGNIQPGDFLTVSATRPGFAMKATTAGPVLGMALTGFSGSTGQVMVFVKATNYNGLDISKQIAGLAFDYSDEAVRSENSNTILASLINNLGAIDEDALSQVVTDVVVANAEIITPFLTTNALQINSLAGATTAGGIEVSSMMVLNGGLRVDSIGAVGDLIALQSDVEFIGTPYFTKDTAGFAVIKAGVQEVDVVFDKEYIVEPIVNASISFDELEDTDLSREEQIAAAKSFMNNGISYVITNKSARGFTIVVSDTADTDIKFSWIALAVKNANTFTSRDPEVTSEPVASSDTNNDDGEVAGSSTNSGSNEDSSSSDSSSTDNSNSDSSDSSESASTDNSTSSESSEGSPESSSSTDSSSDSGAGESTSSSDSSSSSNSEE